MSPVESRIRDFVASELNWPGAPDELTPDVPLVDGVIDSLGIVQVIAFLEREFDVLVRDDELVPRNFASVRAIAAFVEAKRS
jgi:acyl carrier protein